MYWRVQPFINSEDETPEAGQARWLRNTSTRNEEHLATGVREKQAFGDGRGATAHFNHSFPAGTVSN
jgi:hypothetical protein